jgi:cobalt-zinc-cadmium efflux system membrane fusion protein
MPDSKRKASRCEHNMATADCKECSSEVGVVHVSKEMIKETAGKTQSLIGTNKVEEIAVDDIVDTIGQVSLPENDIAHISPRVDGTIRKVFVNLGDKVTIGDRLFQLVSTEIGRSAAAYKKASALVRLASQELARGKKMQKLKVTSDKEVFRLSYELEQASIERASARQELEILGISKAQIDSPVSFKELSRGIVTVTAPVNGSITEKHAVIGEVVSPGESVLIISNLTRLWVWARIYDSNIGLILANRSALKNKEASIRVAAFPGKKFSGTIDYISPIIDKETRTLNLRLTVPNDDGKLLPGMFCRIELPLGQHKIIAVPRYSVLNDGETDFVFVPFGKNTFAAKEVKVGSIHDDHLPVLKGLSKGDTIVTRGTFILKSEVLKERMGAG